MQSIAVLAFHKVGVPSGGEDPTWYYIPTSTFDRYLTELEQGGWEYVDLPTFLAGVLDGAPLPPKSVLLTFDDGYRSFLSTALPILASHSAPAVMFVPTRLVGGHNSFDDLVEPKENLCTWEELRYLESQGISIESHCISHPNLAEIDPDAVRVEVIDSKLAIEDGLGKEVTTIAYPYGQTPADRAELSRLLRQVGYRAGFLYGGGRLRLPITEPYHLARIAMGPETKLADALAAET